MFNFGIRRAQRDPGAVLHRALLCTAEPTKHKSTLKLECLPEEDHHFSIKIAAQHVDRFLVDQALPELAMRWQVSNTARSADLVRIDE